jgi:hypothetical protein
MAVINTKSRPEETFNFHDFIDAGSNNDYTFDKFEIKMPIGQFMIGECNVLDYYIQEIMENCVKVTEFTNEEILKYKYRPDLLAWDIYGNTQLDFLILMCNDMCDPKEFDFKNKYLLLPKADTITKLLSAIYNAEQDWLNNGSNSKAYLMN